MVPLSSIPYSLHKCTSARSLEWGRKWHDNTLDYICCIVFLFVCINFVSGLCISKWCMSYKLHENLVRLTSSPSPSISPSFLMFIPQFSLVSLPTGHSVLWLWLVTMCWSLLKLAMISVLQGTAANEQEFQEKRKAGSMADKWLIYRYRFWNTTATPCSETTRKVSYICYSVISCSINSFLCTSVFCCLFISFAGTCHSAMMEKRGSYSQTASRTVDRRLTLWYVDGRHPPFSFSLPLTSSFSNMLLSSLHQWQLSLGHSLMHNRSRCWPIYPCVETFRIGIVLILLSFDYLLARTWECATALLTYCSLIFFAFHYLRWLFNFALGARVPLLLSYSHDAGDLSSLNDEYRQS